MTSAPEAAELPKAAATTLAAKSAAPPASPWNVEVDVILIDMDSDPPEFEINSYLQDPQDGPLVFNNNHRPGFLIHFNLQDPNGSGYCFPTHANKDDAVWSAVGTTCPTTAIWDVLEPRRIENQQMTLVVRNRNRAPHLGEFRYTLRVTDGTDWKELDPVGNNQNGQES